MRTKLPTDCHRELTAFLERIASAEIAEGMLPVVPQFPQLACWEAECLDFFSPLEIALSGTGQFAVDSATDVPHRRTSCLDDGCLLEIRHQ